LWELPYSTEFVRHCFQRVKSAFQFSERFPVSTEYQLIFKQKKLDAEKNHYFNGLAKISHYKQKEIERTEQISFDQFLQGYFAQ